MLVPTQVCFSESDTERRSKVRPLEQAGGVTVDQIYMLSLSFSWSDLHVITVLQLEQAGGDHIGSDLSPSFWTSNTNTSVLLSFDSSSLLYFHLICYLNSIMVVYPLEVLFIRFIYVTFSGTPPFARPISPSMAAHTAHQNVRERQRYYRF